MRLLGLDLGRKRCGIAVTDQEQIVATALATVPTHKLVSYVKAYLRDNQVEAIVVGSPKNLKGEPSDSVPFIIPIIQKLREEVPEGIPIIEFDERFTSSMALKSMIASGIKKNGRRDKGAVDRIAATLILNGYLDSRLMRQ